MHQRELGPTAQAVCLQSLSSSSQTTWKEGGGIYIFKHITYLLCHEATEPCLAIQTFFFVEGRRKIVLGMHKFKSLSRFNQRTLEKALNKL